MRFSPAVLLLLNIALVGCAFPSSKPPSSLQIPSSAKTSSSEAASLAGSDAGVAEEKLQNLPKLFRENEHHFFVILATQKDKNAANDTAKDLGAWVLPTNLTSDLTPDLYAIVYGPFQTKQVADEKLRYLPTQILKQIKNSYVKDAGSLITPPEFQSYASSIPIQALVAMRGRLNESGLNMITIESQWQEEGGTLCNRISSVYVFTAMKNGEPVRDSMSPEEIALYKKLSRESNPSADRLQWRVNFDVVEQTGEVIGTQLCWD